MITAVCSFGRAGSSLIMKMLQAGGHPILSNIPGSLEHTKLTKLPADHSWLEDNYAVKINDPHIFRLPNEKFEYQFIFITRDPKQQALSMIKMNKLLRPYKEFRPHRESMRQKIKFITQSIPVCLKMFKQKSDRPVLHLQFESVLANPRDTILKICDIVDRPLNTEKMLNVVHLRTGENHIGVMELENENHLRATRHW